jgi:3-dehydrosphinganine reductase
MARYSFDGKKALVTGGSSGIGLATAKALAERGAEVVLVARDEARLETAREAGAARRPDPASEVITRSVDITDWPAVRTAIDDLASAGWTPDVLVNCAGTIDPREFDVMSVEDFHSLMEIDFFGMIHVTKAALPHMLARGSGAIVNVGSVAGFIGVYGYTSYSSAKFATMGYSESLRLELKPRGISVHVVCPPDTDTPFLAFEKSVRPAETEAIAGAVKPIPPEAVAASLVAGVERGKYLIIPGFESTLYFYLKGLVPWLFRVIFDGQVAKTRARRATLGQGAAPAQSPMAADGTDDTPTQGS